MLQKNQGARFVGTSDKGIDYGGQEMMQTVGVRIFVEKET